MRLMRFHVCTGDLFLLVYSVDSRESFEEVLRIRSSIIETKCNIGHNQQSKSKLRVPMIVAGNKCDREMR